MERSGLDQTFSKVTKEEEEEEVDSKPALPRPTTKASRFNR